MVLHPKPAPVAHVSAEFEVEHEGMFSGPGVVAVTAPRIWFAAIDARLIVPELVMVPPESPGPAVIAVTDPPPPEPELCTHWISTTWVLSGMADAKVSVVPNSDHVFADWWTPSNDTLIAAVLLGVDDNDSDVVVPGVKLVPARKSWTTAVPTLADALHPKPAPVVHVSALVAVEHDGMLKGLGVVAVTAPRTVFAVTAASAIVPVVVIVPPDSPTPAVIEMTEPPPPPPVMMLHPKPPPDVQVSALCVVEHDGMFSALGVVAVSAPSTWFADSAVRLV
jgi:hypothetical protein